jgi:hypothetical protein
MRGKVAIMLGGGPNRCPGVHASRGAGDVVIEDDETSHPRAREVAGFDLPRESGRAHDADALR